MWIYKGKRAEDEMYRAMWERATDDFQGFSGVGMSSLLTPAHKP